MPVPLSIQPLSTAWAVTSLPNTTKLILDKGVQWVEKQRANRRNALRRFVSPLGYSRLAAVPPPQAICWWFLWRPPTSAGLLNKARKDGDEICFCLARARARSDHNCVASARELPGLDLMVIELPITCEEAGPDEVGHPYSAQTVRLV